MKLIIAEKPSLGKTIAATLGSDKKQDGYLEGTTYLVSWCFGHLYELFDLEQYIDSDYKKGDKLFWTLDNLPFYPENWNFQYEIKNDPGVRKQVKILKELMNRKDIDTIYAAGDADREGEVIVRLVLDHNLKGNKQVLRLWLPALTPDAIQEGVSTAKPDADYNDLCSAGKTRAGVDWLMGIELTRYASIKSHAHINIGRCICPIVEQVVIREKEIKEFVPQKYLAVTSKEKTNGFDIELTSKQTFTPEEKGKALELADLYNKSGAKVSNIKSTDKIVKSGKLFSMSDLQSYLCKIDKSLTPSNVLDAVQSLYEQAYVTYPRTSSNFLAAGESERVDGILKALQSAGYKKICNKPGNKDIYDDSKVESHSGLTPTNKLPANLAGSEKLAYEAIRNRFMAVFCSEDCIIQHTDALITCADEEFKITGDILKQEGWRQFEASSKKDKLLPHLSVGDPVNVLFKPADKETTPPKRYTVESLNAWMKAPMRGEEKEEVEYTDAEWKDILSEATICTEATRAATIDKCIKSEYIALKNGSYYALENGFFMVDALKDLQIDLSTMKTVEMSRNMHDIAIGKRDPASVFNDTKKMIDEVLAKNADVHSSHAAKDSRETIGKCPRCGFPVYEGAKNFYCSKGKECGFTIWKNSKYLDAMKISITKSMAKKLLKDGKVHVDKLYSSKKEKTFAADLVLDDTGKYVNFKLEFPKK
jgi:DNA topoisomerase-3